MEHSIRGHHRILCYWALKRTNYFESKAAMLLVRQTDQTTLAVTSRMFSSAKFIFALAKPCRQPN
jgi:hypothetical protein